ncbi:MAG: hypothetical protein A2283_18345 [Lentisphaerae bacterium RIFOXYA12_FULL_48_11]|nr:MAG: hypothetical protein A2283_18345 [Lentisphaerae bacterium RIFOXYA12_FULL_48_11]
MFKKKLDKTDLEEIRKRQEMIHQHTLTAQALESQKQAFIIGRFHKYGLDPAKEYSFDLKTGKITDIKKANT